MSKLQKKKTAVIFAAIFAVLLIAELIFANSVSVSMLFGGYERQEISFDKLEISKSHVTSEYIVCGSGATITIDSGGLPVRCVYIEYGSEFAAAGLNSVFEAEVRYALSAESSRIVSAGKSIYCVGKDMLLPLRAGSGAERIEIAFGKCSAYTVSKIVINDAGGFKFGFVRFGIVCVILVAAWFIITRGLYKVVFRSDSVCQRCIYALLAVLMAAFSFFVCAVSIEDEWMHDYPLEKPVDKYGCYVQIFDAFQKGQLNIDTEYDLSIFESLDNPYDYYERSNACGETTGVFWDRAYYDGKLYSYFGIAPVIFLYYPAYFLTGGVLSDALVATLLAVAACLLLMLLLWELCKRFTHGVPFLLMLLAAFALPFGSLIFSTLTCANFYHIAVMSGICAVLAFLLFAFLAEAKKDGVVRKLLFACAGISAAAIVASRPNMVLFVAIAMPVLISVIIKRPNGLKSMLADVAAFAVPMLACGGLIMAYNYARFGSVLDFGNTYQLTLTDTSTYSLSISMLVPMLFHYFFQPPLVNGLFPYLHASVTNMDIYNGWTYLAPTVGAVFFPAVWGNALILPQTRGDRVKRLTMLLAVVAAFAVAFIDMCFAGVHLRYSADIMFILVLFGTLMLLYWVGDRFSSGRSYIYAYVAVILLLALTVATELPLCLDNERDMILKFHTDFYNSLI